jgi:hypothetical protein
VQKSNVILVHCVLDHAISSDFNGKIPVSSDPEEMETSVTLSDVLVFGTGAACKPPMGFHPPPKLAFRDTSRHLTAKTCTNTICLQRQEMNYNTLNFMPHLA